MMRTGHKQRGAALLVVLLIAATLSFIVLGLAQRMGRSIERTAGSAVRGELMWRAVSLETLARAVYVDVKKKTKAASGRFTPAHPLFAAPVALPMPDGEGNMQFADATRCFNLNSLVEPKDRGLRLNESAVEELVEIGKAIGLGVGDMEKLAHVAADWIDDNETPETGGAEDSFYMALPAPFRTGSTLLASVSELRAMDGVKPDLYAAVKPYLCAHPSTEPSVVNINMLRLRDAPLLVGLTGGALSLAAAEDIISTRPPGGWESASVFWSQQALQDIGVDLSAAQERTSIESNYIEVRGRASVNEFDMAVRLLFYAPQDGKDLKLISRKIGADS